MTFTEKVIQVYFNIAYNPVYDFIVARLSIYRRLQKRCISKFELGNNAKVLCVGIGTGNEIPCILEINRNVNITGIDYSSTALRKANKKAIRLGIEIELLLMNAQSLEFAAETFDKALCLHLMDFVYENRTVTREIFRVLKPGGQFVITYPSDKEGLKLGCNIFRDHIYSNFSSRKHRIVALFVALAQVMISPIFAPLLLRPKKRVYSRQELETTIMEFTGHFQLEEDATYQDYIAYGRK